MEQLPRDVPVHILARLELHDLGRTRCVCSCWRRAIGSQEFGQVWQHRDRSCTVLRVRRMCGRLKPKVQGFHTEVWSPGGGGIVVAKSGLSPGPPGSLCIGVTGSSQGLVCGLLVRGNPDDYRLWKSWEPGKEWEFVVGNPVTNRWRTLPPLPLPRRHVKGLEVIHLHVDASGYHLVVILVDRTGPKRLETVFLVRQYDSATGVWSSPGNQPFNGGRVEASGLQVRDVVFTSSALHLRPLFLAAYDPVSRVWSCHKHFNLGPDELDAVPDNALVFGDDDEDETTTSCGVWGWRGKVIFVTTSLKYVVLSELDREAGVWRVVAKERYRDLYRRLGVEWESLRLYERSDWRSVQLAGDLLILSHCFFDVINPGVNAPLAYDLHNSVWHLYDRYMFRTADTEACFTFVPSFIAQP